MFRSFGFQLGCCIDDDKELVKRLNLAKDDDDNCEDGDCGGGFNLTPPSLSLFSLAEAFALSVSAVLTRIELNPNS